MDCHLQMIGEKTEPVIFKVFSDKFSLGLSYTLVFSVASSCESTCFHRACYLTRPSDRWCNLVGRLGPLALVGGHYKRRKPLTLNPGRWSSLALSGSSSRRKLRFQPHELTMSPGQSSGVTIMGQRTPRPFSTQSSAIGSWLSYLTNSLRHVGINNDFLTAATVLELVPNVILSISLDPTSKNERFIMTSVQPMISIFHVQ
ncbi:hypothetical protein CHS0354_008238, partial [Potamilus streckersoni]